MFKDQADFWKMESKNYFERNYNGKNLRKIPLHPYLEKFLPAFDQIDIAGGSMLDIGCGPANNLHHLCNQLKLKRGVGIDPSPDVAKILKNNFQEFDFYSDESHHLSFKENEFDLVLFAYVLHWIDRQYFLQTIGEAIRVTSKFLIVSDFSPQNPYSVDYHHYPQKGYMTYKEDLHSLLQGITFIRCLSSQSFEDDDEWNAARISLYKKVPFEKAYPVVENKFCK